MVVPVRAWSEAVRFLSAAAVALSDGEEFLLTRPMEVRLCWKAAVEETARRGFRLGVILGLYSDIGRGGEGGAGIMALLIVCLSGSVSA